jgi:hypothetical protein
MNVTPAQAGVQFRDSWIPACAGMTDRYHDTELNNILEDILTDRYHDTELNNILEDISRT